MAKKKSIQKNKPSSSSALGSSNNGKSSSNNKGSKPGTTTKQNRTKKSDVFTNAATDDQPRTNSAPTQNHILYGVLAAVLAVIVPFFLFRNDDAPLSFIGYGHRGQQHERGTPLPSSPPHVAPNTSSFKTATAKVAENNYESGISSFDNHVDPHMTRMNFTLPGETVEETFMAYVTPHVSTFYRDGDKNDGEEDGKVKDSYPKRKLKKMAWVGLAGKFVNLSPERMVLNWDDGRGGGVFIGIAAPFEAVSTATFPGHQFYFAPENTDDIKWRCEVVQTQNVYFYDPFTDDDDDSRRKKTNNFKREPRLLDSLKRKKLKKYTIQKRNLAFSKEYKKVTGREYLSLWPARHAPIHKMWNADYFGQQHWVATRETHYIELPPEGDLKSLSDEKIQRHLDDSDPRPLAQYRSPEPTLNLTLTVLSCAPRAFEIRNFLSPIEVDHIVHMATGMKLHISSTSGGGEGKRSTDSSTRSSRNSWVKRMRSPITDSIYRRTADLMRIDEALLRARDPDERPDVPFKSTAAEDLQLVHYGPGQQYTPHHDFSHPELAVKEQPARFATVLLYLNEDLKGGETSFQRWHNSETGVALSVKPEVGKAVLFYSLLPDGNMDDFSQHSATPVIEGEKWLINLWTWDPKFLR